jgi:phage terminase small subunit
MTATVPAPVDKPADKPAQPKRITKKIRAAVDALVHGDAKSITEAAEKAGLSRSHLSRELGKPHITAHLRDKVLRNLAVNSAKAGATKVQLLDSANEMVRDRASSSSWAWQASPRKQPAPAGVDAAALGGRSTSRNRRLWPASSFTFTTRRLSPRPMPLAS